MLQLASLVLLPALWWFAGLLAEFCAGFFGCGFFSLLLTPLLNSPSACSESALLETQLCPWVSLDLLCQGVYLLQCRYQTSQSNISPGILLAEAVPGEVSWGNMSAFYDPFQKLGKEVERC